MDFTRSAAILCANISASIAEHAVLQPNGDYTITGDSVIIPCGRKKILIALWYRGVPIKKFSHTHFAEALRGATPDDLLGTLYELIPIAHQNGGPSYIQDIEDLIHRIQEIAIEM